jgi:hypothetical protein
MDRAEIQSVIGLKNAAGVHREAERLDAALAAILAATSSLEEMLRSANAHGEDESSQSYQELISALAESYGIQGGIYRLMGDETKAIAAYDRGYQFESDPAGRQQNSFNLVQRLVSRIFVDPSSYGRHTWVSEGKDMWAELSKARNEVENQMYGGSRRNDPWAAVDSVLLSILLTPKQGGDTDDRRVMEAFERLEDLGYDPFVCASMIRTFEELERRLTKAAADEGVEGRALAIRYLRIAIMRIKEFSKQSAR